MSADGPRNRFLDEHAEIKAAVTIEPLVLNEDMTRLPGDLAYWNYQFSEAYEAELRAELNVETVEARLYLEVRDDLVQKGEKATVDAIRSIVTTHSAYVTAREQEIAAKALKSRYGGIVDAVRSRRDAMIAIGANLRAEMQGDPSIRGDMRAARVKSKLTLGDSE